jgi:hypothetical protein
MRLIQRIIDFLDQPEVVTFADGDAVLHAELHLAGTASTERDGYVEKEILRTGHWPVIPTRQGVRRQPLTIIRDGASDRERGVIALSEIVDNFKRVGQRVQIPLTDDDDDHKNTLRLNTGFVVDLFIKDTANDARLVALMDFTEDEVKDKVLRGTYADVSCGIPWEFSSRGQKYGAYLEHVAITNRPFIDDLGPFLALSDGDDGPEREVTHFTAPEGVPAPTPPTPVEPPPAPPEVRIVDPYGGLSLREIEAQADSILPEEMKETFRVIDVRAKGIVVSSDEAKQTWIVPFKVEDSKLVATDKGWTYLKYEGEAKPTGEPPDPSQNPEPPAPRREPAGDQVDRDLEAARRVRKERLGVTAADQHTTKEGAHMPLTREELERLDLSAMPDDQRAVFQKLLDENSDLAMSSKESQTNERITELEEMGFKEKPGALKLYRQVMLGDDGGPAVVVLSDDNKKVSKTALSILDEFIEAIKGAEGKVVLSDQADLVPNDQKPPNTPEGEQAPFEDRLAAMKGALAGVHGG